MTATFIAYCITNLLNGKCYIGITMQTLNIRWSEHLSRSKYNKSRSAIHAAIRKYGKENFKIYQIASAKNIDDLKILETILIEQYNTFREGYNLTPGGDFKEIHSETKKKISATKMGHIVSLETREKLRISAIKQFKSKELREKMADKKRKTWKIIYNNNQEIATTNMKQFCKENNISYSHLCKFKKCKKLGIMEVSY